MVIQNRYCFCQFVENRYCMNKVLIVSLLYIFIAHNWRALYKIQSCIIEFDI